MRINDRDKKIFKYLFEQKVASQRSLFERFFPKVAQTTMVRRLQKLTKGKFIGKNGHDCNGRLQIYYFLSPHGLCVIEDDFIFETFQPFFKSSSIEHDLQLSQIRNQLESYEMVENYYSENYLQNCLLEDGRQKLLPLRELNSDAAIRVKTNNGKFWAAIEYERRKKSSSKYIKKFIDYYLRPEVTGVFYICGGEEIVRLITRSDKEAGQEFGAKIFTTLRKNVRGKGKDLPFKNSQGDVFNLQ